MLLIGGRRVSVVIAFDDVPVALQRHRDDELKMAEAGVGT